MKAIKVTVTDPDSGEVLAERVGRVAGPQRVEETMSEPTKWHFIPHPDAERFDAVTLETVERWKESELSGDEWRFSYVATFWSHGQKRVAISAASIADLLVRAASEYSRVKCPDEAPGGFYGDLENLCCQPGCGAPWVVLLHPVKAYTDRGAALVRPYGEKDVRGFCERHRHRGDCALDDTDSNYVVVEERFPPEWTEAPS